MSTVQLRYDPFDAEIQDDPYPIYRQLRDTAPVVGMMHRMNQINVGRTSCPRRFATQAAPG